MAEVHPLLPDPLCLSHAFWSCGFCSGRQRQACSCPSRDW